MDNIASVIIPTYKRFDYLYESIKSVFAQNYHSIEIVVCDDCSPNFKKELIESFIKENSTGNIVGVNVYSNPTNYGTVKNLNNAIKQSLGKYIIILSSDDVLNGQSVISEIVNRLDVSKTQLIVCRRKMINDVGMFIRYMPSDKEIKKLNSMDMFRQHIAFVTGEFYEMASGSATYFTKDFFESVGGYDERFRLLEDWTFFLSITTSNRINYAYDIVSVSYRVGGISSTGNPAIVNDYVNMLVIESKKPGFKNLPYYVKRYTFFNIKRFSGSKISAYLFYPDILIRRFFYKMRLKRYNRPLNKRSKKWKVLY